jgi:hypothetical protein
MKLRSCFLFTFFFALSALFPCFALSADTCISCHTEKGVEVRVPSTKPIQLMYQSEKRSITLADAFEDHGYPCAGVTTTFLAVQYGINLLYDSEIPETCDLVILSRSGTSGALDFIDFLMKGDQHKHKGKGKSKSPEGMKPSRENFVFTILSKSTSQGVDVKLKPEHFPADFFTLKKKQRANSLTPEEWEKIHGYVKNIILTFPTMPADALFGQPQPYHVMSWGCLTPCKGDGNHQTGRP